MEGNKKTSVALSSVFASLLLTVTKFVVGIMTGSMGIISEAAHSFLDLGAAALTYMAVRVSDKPADSKHNYGHGKVESVSALIETGLLFITSFWIVYEAVSRLIKGNTVVEVKWYSFAVIALSVIVDISRSRALSKVAKETKSQALEADALHFSSDILSSLVVLLGLGFVLLKVPGADSIAAIGVAIFVLVAGFKLGKRTIDVLVDAVPEGITESVRGLAANVEGVLGVEKIRIRPSGVSIFVDMLVFVSRKLPLEKVDELVKKIEDSIRKKYPEADVSISTKPVSLSTETIFDRVQLIAASHGVFVHDIVVHSLKNQKTVSFDLEVDNDLSVEASHKVASSLEEDIKKGLEQDIVVVAHIEPINQYDVECKPVSNDELKKIERIFKKIKDDSSLVKDIHDLQIKKVKGKYFITLHCAFNNSVSIKEAHSVASRMEYLAREQLSAIQKVVVHIEPVNE